MGVPSLRALQKHETEKVNHRLLRYDEPPRSGFVQRMLIGPKKMGKPCCFCKISYPRNFLNHLPFLRHLQELLGVFSKYSLGVILHNLQNNTDMADAVIVLNRLTQPFTTDPLDCASLVLFGHPSTSFVRSLS